MTEEHPLQDIQLQRLVPPIGDNPEGVDHEKVMRWLGPGEREIYTTARASIGNDALWACYQQLEEISRLRALGADIIVMYEPRNPEGDRELAEDPRLDVLFPDPMHAPMRPGQLRAWLTTDEQQTLETFVFLSDAYSHSACSCLRAIALLRGLIGELIVKHNIT